MTATHDSRSRSFAAFSLALLFGFSGAIFAPAADALVLSRGPYLQVGTATTQIIRWRTDVASDSRVRVGSSPASLGTTFDNATTTTEHLVTLSGLAPNTVYYYSVGSTATTLAGANVDHFFLTAPEPGTAEAVRIWVLGDAGTAGPTGASASQSAVRDAYMSWNQQYTDLVLLLGDNAYETGTDAEYQNAIFSMYGNVLRQTNLWSTIGNHDTAQSSNPNILTTPYFNIFTLPAAGEAGGLPSGSKKYFSFDFANIHFVCLDSMTSNRSPSGAMLTWLAADLAATTQTWIIAFWHHPPYSKGSHNSDMETQLAEMRANALPILEAYGVDLVLSGHSHSYERSKLIGGHYGLSNSLTDAMIKDAGSGRPSETGAYTKATDPYRAVYAVAGSSGQTSGGFLNHPAMYISLNNLGSMVLDVNADTLNAKFLRENQVVADSFTIVKTAANIPPTVSMTAPTSGAAFNAPANINLAANAADTDGNVTKVEFFNGATLLGSDTSVSYNFAWNGVGAGNYTLTARATDNSGATTTSNPINVSVVSALPMPPSALGATAVSTSQVNLAWADNSNNETGFKIERSNGKSFTQIATVGAGVTTYASTGLKANTNYSYRVRAYNASGNSAYSNTASAKTPRR